LLLDKPGGLTSNRALQRVKRLFQAAKAGHTGSLDPLATGMLPICLGSATKVSAYLLGARKSYSVVCRLGIATTTDDAEGEILERRDGPVPAHGRVVDVLQRFRGTLEQIPPMHSALKQDGKRLYVLARQGLTVPRQARRIEIFAIDLTGYAWPELRFTVTCSKGTYVRTLVTDIAAALGTVGHVAGLRRTAVEPYSESQMITLDALAERAQEGGLEAVDRDLLPLDSALPAWPRAVLDAAAAERLARGQKIAADPTWGQGWVKVYRGSEFLAIAEVTAEGCLAPRRVFDS
jgi:tRNA pseudouridine55 synthase